MDETFSVIRLNKQALRILRDGESLLSHTVCRVVAAQLDGAQRLRRFYAAKARGHRGKPTSPEIAHREAASRPRPCSDQSCGSKQPTSHNRVPFGMAQGLRPIDLPEICAT
jgi:hypothetical protein